MKSQPLGLSPRMGAFCYGLRVHLRSRCGRCSKFLDKKSENAWASPTHFPIFCPKILNNGSVWGLGALAGALQRFSEIFIKFVCLKFARKTQFFICIKNDFGPEFAREIYYGKFVHQKFANQKFAPKEWFSDKKHCHPSKSWCASEFLPRFAWENYFCKFVIKIFNQKFAPKNYFLVKSYQKVTKKSTKIFVALKFIAKNSRKNILEQNLEISDRKFPRKFVWNKIISTNSWPKIRASRFWPKICVKK